MYSFEQRVAAINLYIKYNLRASTVIQELGYPDRHVLAKWYEEYRKDGEVRQHGKKRKPKYSAEQRAKAVEYYLSHGKSIVDTRKALGYPGKATLSIWLSEDCPSEKRYCKSGVPQVHLTQEQKEQVAIELCTRDGSAQEIADRYNISRYTVYDCKWRLFGKGTDRAMAKKISGSSTSLPEQQLSDLQSEIAQLQKEKDELSRQVYRLQLEKDVLATAAEVLKKGQGATLTALTNREKAIVIDALRSKYKLKELLLVLDISKSSYCYQAAAMRGKDKYEEVRKDIIGTFYSVKMRYGYRRIHCVLKNKSIQISEKVVRKIMKEEHLVVPFVKMKRYSSYVGEVTPAVPNLVKRDFHAAAPNILWLTDITEFHIASGKVYLSPMIDCFDGLPVAWTIGTSPTSELANSMLDLAVKTLKDDEHPTVHTDRGGHYRWPGWIERMDNARLTRSMSRKGCSPDNAACEGFHGRLKNEFFYNRDWRDTTLPDFISQLDEYIHWYSEERIKTTLGGMSPIQYRQALGLCG